MNGMNMYFSARTQTLAQFKEAYDNGKNPELVLYKKRWQMGLLPSGAVTTDNWGIKLGSPKKGDSPHGVGNVAKRQKRLPCKGSWLWAMRTDWGIKKPKYFLFKIYFLRKSLRVALTRPTSLYKGGKSLRLALTRPTSILREARRREKWMVKSKIGKHFLCLPIYGWGGRIWTYECSSQSAVSYRLTPPQYLLF